jgi:hypothetical protein
MPAEQPVQHFYQVWTPKGTEVGVMAPSAEAAIQQRRRDLLIAWMRRTQRNAGGVGAETTRSFAKLARAVDMRSVHATAICPGCGAKPAAVSDLYPEAKP